MAKLRKLVLLAAAAEAARRYASNNPDQAGKFLDQAAEFANDQTKGKYSSQIDGVVRKAKDLAGIPTTPSWGAFQSAGNGYGAHSYSGRH